MYVIYITLYNKRSCLSAFWPYIQVLHLKIWHWPIRRGNLVNMLPNLRSTYLSVISTLINLISRITVIYKKVLGIMFNEKNCQYFKQFIRNSIILFIGGTIGISFFFTPPIWRKHQTEKYVSFDKRREWPVIHESWASKLPIDRFFFFPPIKWSRYFFLLLLYVTWNGCSH